MTAISRAIDWLTEFLWDGTTGDFEGIHKLRRELEAEATRIAELEQALKPFAELCQWLTEDIGPNGCTDEEAILVTDWEVGPRDRDQITAGMIRAARTALRGQGKDTEGNE